MTGPLAGVRVVELAGMGPAPFGAMLLADMGAEVIRVERAGSRPGSGVPKGNDVLIRGRRSIAVNLKDPEGVELVSRLVDGAAVFLEGFRPGVTERLGLGPEVLLERNPRLVYGRMTGWGREGPLSAAPSHDINAIALAGALEPMGRQGEKPTPPLTVVGDFAGGGLLLAFGIACAVREAERSGAGQVVDLSMVEGSALLMTLFYGLDAYGEWGDRGANVLDTGAPFYEVYETSDGRYVSIAALEPPFYAALRAALDLTGPEWDDQMDTSRWPARKRELATLFASRTRDEWCALLEGSDVCFAPVLSLREAPDHPQNRAQGTFVDVGGVPQPRPAPRFSRTPTVTPAPPPAPGADTERILTELGWSAEHVAALRGAGVVA